MNEGVKKLIEIGSDWRWKVLNHSDQTMTHVSLKWRVYSNVLLVYDSDIPMRTAFPIKCMTQKVNIHNYIVAHPENMDGSNDFCIWLFSLFLASTCYLHSRNAQYSWTDIIEGTLTPIERTNKNTEHLNNSRLLLLRSSVLINQTWWIKVFESNCLLVNRCFPVEWRFRLVQEKKKASEEVKKSEYRPCEHLGWYFHRVFSLFRNVHHTSDLFLKVKKPLVETLTLSWLYTIIS